METLLYFLKIIFFLINIISMVPVIIII